MPSQCSLERCGAIYAHTFLRESQGDRPELHTVQQDYDSPSMNLAGI